MDCKLTLTPRAYLTNPHAFGTAIEVFAITPADGDEVSRLVALRQHALAARFNKTPVDERLSTATVTRLFGISKQSWSRILLGQTWARQLGMTAVEMAIAANSHGLGKA